MAAKRSVMILYSTEADIYCHQLRIVLAEKGVNYEIVNVEPGNEPEDFIELNPYGTTPTLVDRELVLYDTNIILEYLDERFPHPPLMPVYPVARARSRLMLHRVYTDWYGIMEELQMATPKAQEKLSVSLHDSVLALSPAFQDQPYFLSEEFTVVDCALGPLFWRMRHMGIEVKGRGAKPIRAYMDRLFERESFKDSLSEAELDMVVDNT